MNDIIQLVIQDIQKQRQVLNRKTNNDDNDDNSPKIILLPSLAEKGYDNSTDIVVKADREWIVQVLTNLLDNALKFNSKKDTISINVDVQGNDKNKEAVVSVKDNGVGIDLEIMPKLFTKFTTKSGTKKGIGLGLYISRNIIEAHEGRIWAENNTGKGTTFSFSLPLSE